MNYTLTIDLSKSWTPGNAPIDALIKDAAPTRNYGSLWADSDNSVYSFGGTRSLILSESDISTNPGLQLWRFTGSNWSQILDSPSTSSPTLTKISPAAGGSAFANGVGYMLGGFIGDVRSGPMGDVVYPSTGLLSYNSTSNIWSNDSTAAVTPYGLIGNQMVYAAEFGTEGVLITLGGQFTGPGNWTDAGENFVSFSNISVYHMASKSWLWQTATGNSGPEDIPPSRTVFCAAGIQSPQGTYEVLVYGGYDDSFVLGSTVPSSNDNAKQAEFNSVYVLSLPGFVWFKVNDTSAEPRTVHQCHTVGNRQVVSVGGLNPALDYNTGFNTTDSWPQGLGIFDMVDLKWTNSYDADAAPYTIPTVMQHWYTQS